MWVNGLVAKLTRQVDSRREIAPGRVVKGRAMVTRADVARRLGGTAVWFEKDQVFAYTLPGLMTGAVVIAPEDLKGSMVDGRSRRIPHG